MKIKIKKITLTNFKCFRNFELNIGNDITVISGRNGSGKTTIADAVLFCFFGKNSAGQSDLELFKTRENGKVIPNLDHSVEIVLETSTSDDITTDFVLKRSIKEVWVKKRGAEQSVFKNNNVEYYVNGEVLTKADFDKQIKTIVDEEVFRAITNPTYFPSLKWQLQREFLTRLVDMSDFCATRAELDGALASIPAGQSIEEYMKHIKYQISEIKKKLERIPVRLEEQNKALPDCLDWDEIKKKSDQVTNELSEVENKIIAIRSGNGGDVKRAEIREKLKEHSNKLSAIESRTRELLAKKEIEHHSAISKATAKFNSLVITQRDIEQVLKSHEPMMKRCKETLDECEKDACYIREAWAANIKRQLDFNENDCVCPTCGQYLPPEQIQEKKNTAISNLNKLKADTKASLTNKANIVKQLREDTERHMAELDQKKAEMEQRLASTKEAINEAFSEKAKVEKTKLPTYDELLAQDTEYQKLLQVGKSLNEAMDATYTDDDCQLKQQLEELTSRKDSLTEENKSLSAQLAIRPHYEKGLALIQEIRNEEKNLISQLCELEKKEDVVFGYIERYNTVLEERINQHFDLVKWRLFRTINNGGDSFDEPYCECLVNGNPYDKGLNSADCLNAGLDIINTLSRHYGVCAPIVIDNAESCLNIINTSGQQIRLYVSPNDLVVKNG
ncbi:MAG: AAA family ATPase [Prevotella sp.]|nr:AAA family ATPase [Prevotella sp.]